MPIRWILFLIFTAGCLSTQGQESSGLRALSNEVKTAAWEIMRSAPTCALISLDAEGRPRVRAMEAFPPEADFTVWFGTNSLSRKVEQIRKDPRVTLYYLDQNESGYVMIHGQAELITDPAAKKKWWKKDWKAFYPNYPEGYVLIRVIPEWMEVISNSRGIFGDALTWQPDIQEFSQNGSDASGQDDPQAVQTFEGIVKEYEDSGLGPFYQIRVANSAPDDSFFGLIMLGLVEELHVDQIVGKKVRISYQMETENHLDSIQLKAHTGGELEPENSNQLTATGKFESCEQGDMGGYLYIQLATGETRSFLTDFFCPEAINPGDEVIVFYQINRKKNITGIELIE